MGQKITPSSWVTVNLTGLGSAFSEIAPAIITPCCRVADFPILPNNGTLIANGTGVGQGPPYPPPTVTTSDGSGCDNDRCYYRPFVDGDKIFVQYQFDRINGQLVTDYMRASNRWKDCNAAITGLTLSKDTPNNLLSQLGITVHNLCNGDLSSPTNACLEVFLGFAIDKEKSKALGWIGIDPATGWTTDPAKTVWFGYLWFSVNTSKITLPDLFELSFRGNFFGVDKFILLERFERLKCNAPSFTVSGQFTYRDCFGFYFGLPYSCHYLWFSSNLGLGTLVPIKTFTCPGGSGRQFGTAMPYYTDFRRYRGSFEKIGYTIKKENHDQYHGATASTRTSQYRAIPYAMPPYVAEILSNSHNGKRVYVNGIAVLAEGFAKDSEVTRQWWPEITYSEECEIARFCSDCESR